MKSMTGFGSGQVDSHLGSATVVLRSVNSRFLEITFRLPNEYQAEEPMLRTELQRTLQRGKVSVSVQLVPMPGVGVRHVVNTQLLETLEGYIRGRGYDPDVSQLLTIPGVVIAQPVEEQAEGLRAMLRRALSDAVAALGADREREGEVLRKALEELRLQMKDRLEIIAGARKQVVEKFRQRLKERLDEMLGPSGATLDAGRLEQEVALFADRADLEEEVTRLGAHLDHLGELLAGSGNALGRQLDFLSQEMLRETNTIGSKARDLDITRQVLDLKTFLEAFKEQIANVE